MNFSRDLLQYGMVILIHFVYQRIDLDCVTKLCHVSALSTNNETSRQEINQ